MKCSRLLYNAGINEPFVLLTPKRKIMNFQTECVSLG
jgi:hypothetical protein